MFLLHNITARERPPGAWRPLASLLVGAPVTVVVGVVVLVVGGAASAAAGVLLVGAGLVGAVVLLGWRWPMEYLLTDSHLRLKMGLGGTRWVPMDQVQTVSRLEEGSEYLEHGFVALGAARPLIIVNPELGDARWVIFTPSAEFLGALLWQLGRAADQLDPLPPGPPRVRSSPWVREEDKRAR